MSNAPLVWVHRPLLSALISIWTLGYRRLQCCHNNLHLGLYDMVKWLSIQLNKGMCPLSHLSYHGSCRWICCQIFCDFHYLPNCVGLCCFAVYFFWWLAFRCISGIYYSDAEKSQCVDLALRELLSNIIVSRGRLDLWSLTDTYNHSFKKRVMTIYANPEPIIELDRLPSGRFRT